MATFADHHARAVGSPGRHRYRIPSNNNRHHCSAAAETQCELQRPSTGSSNTAAFDSAHRLAAGTTCAKCGKRKPEARLNHELPLSATHQAAADSTPQSHAKNVQTPPRGQRDLASKNCRKESKNGCHNPSWSSGCPRAPTVIFNGNQSGSDQVIPCDTQNSSYTAQGGNGNNKVRPSGLGVGGGGGGGAHPAVGHSSSSEFGDRDAVTRKVDKVLLSRSSPPPLPPRQQEQSRKRSRHGAGFDHYHHSHQRRDDNRRPRERENRRPRSDSASPVVPREPEGSSGRSKEDHHVPSAKQSDHNPTEPKRKINHNDPTSTPTNLLQNPLEGAKLQAKDFSELGRRIWQNLFEATDPHYSNTDSTPSSSAILNGSVVPDIKMPPPLLHARHNFLEQDEESVVPGRLRGSVMPRHVRWQTQSPNSSHCGSRLNHRPPGHASPTAYQYNTSAHSMDQNNADGKFIRMKFGKKVKMVQIPSRNTVDTVEDEVQVLVRHGKSVIWRNYKTFDHE